MNKSLVAAVAAGGILLLSGCSPIQMDVEELMSPPKLTAEQAEIDSALKQALGENVKLKYPKSGDFRSAFVFHDIDGDGEEEAIVFYQLDSSSTTWLTVMDRTDGQWRSTYSLSLIHIFRLTGCKEGIFSVRKSLCIWIDQGGFIHGIYVAPLSGTRFFCPGLCPRRPVYPGSPRRCRP